MASRIGKYKVSKKETALSSIDGGQIVGNVTIKGGTSDSTGHALKKTGSLRVSSNTILAGATTLSHAGIKFSGLASGDIILSESLDSGILFKTASAFLTSSNVGTVSNSSGKIFDVLCVTR